jgi:hypothetical protein
MSGESMGDFYSEQVFLASFKPPALAGPEAFLFNNLISFGIYT